MTCSRCKGRKEIVMYMAYDKDGKLTTIKSSTDKIILADRTVTCWLCNGTGEE